MEFDRDKVLNLFISATTTTTTTLRPPQAITIKPICLKLLQYPLLLKVAKWKCICPEYHHYYQQPYQPIIQQLKLTTKPIKYRRTFAQPIVYRPTKAQASTGQKFKPTSTLANIFNFAQTPSSAQSSNLVLNTFPSQSFNFHQTLSLEQVFNFRPTPPPAQVFNFRPTIPKYQEISNHTLKPQFHLNFPSDPVTKPFTGYSLNYNPTTASTSTQKDGNFEPILVRPTVPEDLNFFPFKYQDYDFITTAKFFDKLDLKMDLGFNKNLR